jgi:hypothetical protein
MLAARTMTPTTIGKAKERVPRRLRVEMGSLREEA